MLKALTPNIMVENVSQTMDYYRDLFGFEPIMTVPENAPYDWAMMQNGSVTIMFQSRTSLGNDLPQLKDKPTGGTLNFYIDVEDVKSLYERVRNRVTIVSDLQTTFYGATEFTISDCNDYLLTFAQQGDEA
jgi:lactoylglutathione lyase